MKEKGLTIAAFAKHELEELLKDRAKALDLEEKRDRQGKLLQALQADDLVAAGVPILAMVVLKGVVHEWQWLNPDISNYLSLTGPRQFGPI